MLKSTQIALPPLEEQKRVAARIEDLFRKLDEMKRVRKETNAKAKALVSSALHEVFSKADEKGWRLVNLRDIVETMNGLVIKQDPENKNGYPISRIETIQRYEVDPNRVRYIEVTSELYDRYKYEKGDILFSHINSFELVGKVALYRERPKDLIHGMNLLRIRVKNRKICDPNFLYWYLRTQKFRSMLEPLIKRAINQASVNQTNLKSVHVPLSPIVEQKRIVAYLDKVQERSATLQKLQKGTGERITKLRASILNRALRGEL